MSTTRDVDFGGVHVRGAWNAPGGDVRAELVVYTKTGQARIAPLDERQLTALAAEAIDALRKLQTHDAVTAREAKR